MHVHNHHTKLKHPLMMLSIVKLILCTYATYLNVHVLELCLLPLVLSKSFIYCRILRSFISDLLSQKEPPQQKS